MIIKICKIHGELTKEKTTLNRLSLKGKKYLRCRICRNLQERKRIKTKYLKTPSKHKLPENILREDRSHAYTIRHRFKMSIQEYNLLLEKQNHLCAICKKPETQLKKNYNKVKMLSVDHCHTTGKIRGLLCHKCNTGLGSFKDSIENLNAAIQYLQSTQ